MRSELACSPCCLPACPAALQRERELEAQRQEGYNRMLEEAGDWTEAGAAPRRYDQQAARAPPALPQQQRRGGGDAGRVIAIPRSVLGSAPAMPVPKRGSQASAGASWAEQAAAPATAPASSASSATTAAGAPAAAGGAAEQGGWRFEGWQETALARQEDEELDSLLAVSRAVCCSDWTSQWSGWSLRAAPLCTSQRCPRAALSHE